MILEDLPYDERQKFDAVELEYGILHAMIAWNLEPSDELATYFEQGNEDAFRRGLCSDGVCQREQRPSCSETCGTNDQTRTRGTKMLSKLMWIPGLFWLHPLAVNGGQIPFSRKLFDRVFLHGIYSGLQIAAILVLLFS